MSTYECDIQKQCYELKAKVARLEEGEKAADAEIEQLGMSNKTLRVSLQREIERNTSPLLTVWVRPDDIYKPDPNHWVVCDKLGTSCGMITGSKESWEFIFDPIATVRVWIEGGECDDFTYYICQGCGVKLPKEQGRDEDGNLFCPDCEKPAEPQHEWVYFCNTEGWIKQLIAEGPNPTKLHIDDNPPTFGVRKVGATYRAYRDGAFILSCYDWTPEGCLNKVLAMLTPAQDAVRLEDLEVVG